MRIRVIWGCLLTLNN